MSVILSRGWEACVVGLECMAGGACVGGGAYVSGVCAWRGGIHGKGACVAGETATAAGSTHPTGLHSCFISS